MEILNFYFDVCLVGAVFCVDGKIFDRAVWEQAGRHFVTTGAKMTHNLKRYYFTDQQEQQYQQFLEALKGGKPHD